jgi:hypothetical protein
VDDHEAVEIGGEFGRGGGDGLDVEGRAHFSQHRPLGGGALGAGVEASGHLQAGDEAQRGLVGVGEFGDELGDLVFEEAFVAGVEDGDDLTAVEGVGRDEAEIEALGLRDGLGLDAVGDGVVLFFAEGFGVDDGEVDLAVGVGLDGLEEFGDALPNDSSWGMPRARSLE